MQMAGFAQTIRKLGHDLQEVQPLGKKRRHPKDLFSPASRSDTRHTRRGAGRGQRLVQGSSQRTRGVEKNGKQAIGKSKGGWNTKLHVVSADDKVVVEMHLSSGECHDAPQGRVSIATVGTNYPGVPFLMDKV